MIYGFNKSMLRGAVNPIDFVISVVIVVIVVAAEGLGSFLKKRVKSRRLAIPTINEVLLDANIKNGGIDIYVFIRGPGIPATILSVIPTFIRRRTCSV